MFDGLFAPSFAHGGGVRPLLGPEYLLSDSGALLPPGLAHSGATIIHAGSAAGGAPGGPASTLVGASSGLQINLIWDASVRAAPNWSAIEQAVVSAARIYATAFSNHAVLNIAVGLGEVAGSALGADALGESESLGYLTSYATVTHALASADTGLVGAGLLAAGAVGADALLAGKSFFVSSAEAKALGLANPWAAAVDGYIGLANTSQLFFAAGGSRIGAGQYDAVGVAAHELSEVMGRLGMEGGGGDYTPLDLFRYTAAQQPDLAPTAGYFSTDLGVTVLNLYNAPANGGDAGDWASISSNGRDAYDAFDNPGVITSLSRTDLLEVAVLGYRPAGSLLGQSA